MAGHALDVIVVGAGPAGAELSARVARGGASVLLLDQLRDLRHAAFSSAALPWDAVEAWQLPAEVVAAHWHQWMLIGPGDRRRCWASPRRLGAVLDFGALRSWLVQRAQEAGAELRLGWRAERWQPLSEGGGAQLLVRTADGQRQWLRCRWLVDASGQQRALLGNPDCTGDALVSGAGAEWLLQVEPQRWQPWADRLSFLLGSSWVPQGYGWVFPMQPGVLKLGVCRLLDPQRVQPPLHRLLYGLLQRLQLQDAPVLDRHGGWIRSTIARREAHRNGPLLGLGDAVSTANLLGGEGIRHALTSSAVLAPLLLKALHGQERALHAYPKRLRQALGWRWSLSGRLARRTWLGLDGPAADRRLERLLAGLESQARAEDLSDLLFHYRFERYGWRALPYVMGWR